LERLRNELTHAKDSGYNQRGETGMAGVKDWLNQKFQDWEKSQGKSQSYFAFARFLEVSQTNLAAWMSGTEEPGKDDLATLAEKLGPGIFEAAGMRPADAQLDRLVGAFNGLPGGLRERLTAAVVSAEAAIRERGLAPESIEAKRITVEILAKHGIKLTNLNSG
jgi:transcriptional regulator with XRE-family HTH domain